MTHTLGHWYVSPAGSMVLARADDGGPEKIVGHLSLTNRPAEVVGNAALFAAAPALYAALAGLEGLVLHLSLCPKCRHRLYETCDVTRAAIDACRAALAKARQGQEVRS